MKVYVLTRCTQYEGDVILGVFSSIEKLKKHTETFGVVPVWNDDDTIEWIQNRYGYYYYSCDEFHLDEAYND